jgi:flagellar motor switch protein FliN/FliY
LLLRPPVAAKTATPVMDRDSGAVNRMFPRNFDSLVRCQGWCDMADDDPTPASETSSESPAENTAADPLAEMSAASPSLENVEADLASAQASIDELLKQANFEDPSSLQVPENQVPTQAFDLQSFAESTGATNGSSIELLRDVDLNVKIELGRARMLVEDVLKLGEGSVVELDKLAGDPVDVYVNDRLVARGEVLVLNDNFCVRVNEIMAGVREEGL